MDDWKVWHNDVLRVIPLLDRVCELEFPVEEAEDSEDEPEVETFTLSDADKEGMFSRELSDVGEDWIRAVAQLTNGQDNRRRIPILLKMFEHPVCKKVKPRILLKEEISQEMFSGMTEVLEVEIAELETLMEKLSQKDSYYYEFKRYIS